MKILRICLVWLRQRPVRRGLLLVAVFYVLYIGRFFFWPPVYSLESGDPGLTSFMEYRLSHWEKNGKNMRIRRTWVPIERISNNLKRAVVVAEDSTFWEHSGFDVEGIRIAFQKNIAKGKIVSGGSTITQQLAKNMYFSPAKSFTRKAQEAIVAWRLERTLSKERILELYLNVVEWGDGIYGAEAAARRYFNTSAASLTPKQAAVLAALLPDPRGRKPDSRIVQKISAIILRRM